VKLIYAKNLWKRYGKFDALQGLEINVPKGIYGFIGPNGAGKTTFIKILAGILRYERGEIYVMEKKPREAKREVGFVYDHGNFPPEIEVEYLLQKIRKMFRIGKSEMKYAMEITSLKDVLHRRLGELSAGYKRRVNLAVAILHMPSLLVMDEPFNEIDPVSRLKIKDAIFRLRKEGMNFFISSHNLSELEEIITHFGVIINGKIVREGKFENKKYVVIHGEKPSDIRDYLKNAGYKAEIQANYVVVFEDIKKIFEILKDYKGNIQEVKSASLEMEFREVIR